jgi:hypothetical protein
MAGKIKLNPQVLAERIKGGESIDTLATAYGVTTNVIRNAALKLVEMGLLTRADINRAPQSALELTACPSCGEVVGPTDHECIHCGVIFQRLRPSMVKQRVAPKQQEEKSSKTATKNNVFDVAWKIASIPAIILMFLTPVEHNNSLIVAIFTMTIIALIYIACLLIPIYPLVKLFWKQDNTGA